METTSLHGNVGDIIWNKIISNILNGVRKSTQLKKKKNVYKIQVAVRVVNKNL